MRIITQLNLKKGQILRAPRLVSRAGKIVLL
jgi:hypothetical protein